MFDGNGCTILIDDGTPVPLNSPGLQGILRASGSSSTDRAILQNLTIDVSPTILIAGSKNGIEVNGSVLLTECGDGNGNSYVTLKNIVVQFNGILTNGGTIVSSYAYHAPIDLIFGNVFVYMGPQAQVRSSPDYGSSIFISVFYWIGHGVQFLNCALIVMTNIDCYQGRLDPLFFFTFTICCIPETVLSMQHVYVSMSNQVYPIP